MKKKRASTKKKADEPEPCHIPQEWLNEQPAPTEDVLNEYISKTDLPHHTDLSDGGKWADGLKGMDCED